MSYKDNIRDVMHVWSKTGTQELNVYNLAYDDCKRMRIVTRKCAYGCPAIMVGNPPIEPSIAV